MKTTGTIIAALALAACGGLSPNPGPPPAATVPATAASQVATLGHGPPGPAGHSACDRGLWSHIYHPYRLHVISACKTITGTVEGVQQEPDGDLHILLRPDPAYADLINGANTEFENGDLVLEEICVGVITQADAVAACRNFAPPSVSGVSAGDHVKVTGSYVLDAVHGWMEIHPISQISVIRSAPASPATAPRAAGPWKSSNWTRASGSGYATTGSTWLMFEASGGPWRRRETPDPFP